MPLTHVSNYLDFVNGWMAREIAGIETSLRIQRGARLPEVAVVRGTLTAGTAGWRPEQKRFEWR